VYSCLFSGQEFDGSQGVRSLGDYFFRGKVAVMTMLGAVPASCEQDGMPPAPPSVFETEV
jgi:hypothetical protein